MAGGSHASRAFGLVLRLLGGLLLDDIEHLPFDSLLLENQAVLVPDEIWSARVELVPLHAAFEQADDVAVIRVLGEAEATAVMHELLELFGLVAAEVLDRSLLLLLLDVSVLFSLRAAGQALPREGTAQEVKDNVTDGLEVISPGLLVAEVSVHGGVAGSTSQVLAVAERDVLTVGRLETLGKTEVDDVHSVLCLVVAANQEVIWLNVTMDDALLVNNLDALDHLRGDVQDGLEVELAAALLEQVLE